MFIAILHLSWNFMFVFFLAGDVSFIFEKTVRVYYKLEIYLI
jgi:hypothetical protein